MERKEHISNAYDWMKEEYGERAVFSILGEFKENGERRKSFCFGGAQEKLVSLFVDTMDEYPEVYHLLKTSVQTLDAIYAAQREVPLQ